MASPPAKRQRRSTVVLSAGEEVEPPQVNGLSSTRETRTTKSNDHPTPKTHIAATRSKTSSAARKTTPKKPTKKPTSLSPNSPKNQPKSKKAEEPSKSIHSFFGKASEEQRWNRKRTETPDARAEDVEDGDPIEDDDSSDAAFAQVSSSSVDKTRPLDRRKSSLTQGGPPSSSQRFVKRPLPTKIPKGITTTLEADNPQSQRPWADRYGPVNIEELAIHKKKAQDVQKWLADVFAGRERRRMLVLKGPAGSGKTTTVSLLSQALGFQLLHWTNPTVSDKGYTSSVASQFDDFLNRGGQFGSLDFGSAPSVDNQGASEAELPRVLLVEEFPSTMTRSSTAVDSFRNVLLRYLATESTNQPVMFGRTSIASQSQPPLVIVISESLLTSATAATDSFTAHRLLGHEISNHQMVTMMDFNTVAPTFVAKALDLVIKKEARDSQRRRIPGPAVLKRLSEVGDIRSAVNALEFLCARSGDDGSWSGRVAAKSRKSDKDGATLTEMEKNSIELVTQREATLGMFHAVGKVVYNKRENPHVSDPSSEPPPKPPDHLHHADRPKISQINIDDLMNETGTDVPTFIASLHENFLLSCSGAAFAESLDSCISILSESDLLSPDSRPGYGVNHSSTGAGRTLSHAGGLDVLRQNEISFQVAVRGLLFLLPYPVTRAAHPGGRKGDSFKMFYPSSLRLWKPMEETDGLISSTMDRPSIVAAPTSGKYGVQAGGTHGGVASWRYRSNAFASGTSDVADTDVARIVASRADMIFDRLPYMNKIMPNNGTDIRKVRRITELRGVNLQEDMTEEEEDVPDGTELTTGDDVTDRGPISPRKCAQVVQSKVGRGGEKVSLPEGPLSSNVELEKLYISDDDIEDD